MNERSVIIYSVFSFDIWGHSSEDCCTAYGCPCMVKCEECDGKGTGCGDCEGEGSHDCLICEGEGIVHDPDGHECDAGFEVNDRFRCGSIEVETDEGATHNIHLPEHRFTSWHCSDQAIVQALIDGDFLKESVKVSDIEIDGDGEENGSLYLQDAKDCRPLFALEFVKAEPKED